MQTLLCVNQNRTKKNVENISVHFLLSQVRVTASPWILLKSVSGVSHPVYLSYELTFPSQVKNLPVSLKPFVLITLSIDETDSSVLMMPSTSHPTDTLAISLEPLLGGTLTPRRDPLT